MLCWQGFCHPLSLLSIIWCFHEYVFWLLNSAVTVASTFMQNKDKLWQNKSHVTNTKRQTSYVTCVLNLTILYLECRILGLVNVDNSGVTAGLWGINGNGKNTVKQTNKRNKKMKSANVSSLNVVSINEHLWKYMQYVLVWCIYIRLDYETMRPCLNTLRNGSINL